MRPPARRGRGPSTGQHESLYRELIPAHGLGLLMLDPAVLGGAPVVAWYALRRRPGREQAEPAPLAGLLAALAALLALLALLFGT